MKKMKKRALALLLALSVVFTSQMRMESMAMSAGGVVAGGGAVIGAETALAYLLGVFGLTAASAAVYENRDSILKWGKARYSDLSSFVEEKTDQLGVTAASMSAWLEKLGKGTLDKASSEWAAFKAWVASIYAVGGMMDTVISDPADYPVIDGVLNVGNCTTWVWDLPYIKGDYIHHQTYQLQADEGFLFTCIVKSGSFKNLACCFVSIGAMGTLLGSSYRTSISDGYVLSGTVKSETQDLIFYADDLYYKYSLLTSDLTATAPNYMGECSKVEDLIYGAYRKYIAGGFDVPKTKAYTEIGGISSAYDAGKTLDNIDIVGSGTVAGATDIPISFPTDDTFGGLIGGAISGANTWQDVIDALGVGVISREGEHDLVIDNTGVTTTDWDYAIDKPGTGDGTDTPGAGETDTDVPKDLESYTFAGLEKIFPFCLPFDLIDFLKALDAPAEAPHFVYSFPYPTLDGMKTYDIDIDLSEFDSVAEISRTMECLAFIVGLILITRSKMIRG